MYVISEDNQSFLIKTNLTIKKNLKTWLHHYRMIGDTIDILDPYIINIGIEFIVKPTTSTDKFILMDNCINTLKKKYSVSFFIGEPIYISDLYLALKDVTGVLDVVRAKLVNKTGGDYSSTELDINGNLSPQGDYLMVPKNVILEIKFPATDIKGKIR